jgi:thioesterase domain-containing protein
MFRTSALEQILHTEIPISREMGIRVSSYDGARLTLDAPLAPNTNHKSTAFGGSLYSIAVLCGWGLLHLKLADARMHKHIVIQDSRIRHLHPVVHDLHAECRLDDAAFKHFFQTLNLRGRARISLDVVITDNDRTAVEFSGRYVVHG